MDYCDNLVDGKKEQVNDFGVPMGGKKTKIGKGSRKCTIVKQDCLPVITVATNHPLFRHSQPQQTKVSLDVLCLLLLISMLTHSTQP